MVSSVDEMDRILNLRVADPDARFAMLLVGQVIACIILEVRGVEARQRNVRERIRDIVRVNTPAALDARSGERHRIDAIPDRAALEQLLIRPDAARRLPDRHAEHLEYRRVLQDAVHGDCDES